MPNGYNILFNLLMEFINNIYSTHSHQVTFLNKKKVLTGSWKCEYTSIFNLQHVWFITREIFVSEITMASINSIL